MHCPYCDTDILVAAPVHAERAPGPGDIMMCNGCWSWLVFDENCQTREPNQFEARWIANDPRCASMREQARKRKN